ncbi:WD40 repeat domain-containing protein [Paenibacillus sp. WLX1005]|uniref:TolB family protein n=1 Tax=Paenibacillus sp. WLX1005 TaxID=3243766 RepID=UPI003983DC94
MFVLTGKSESHERVKLQSSHESMGGQLLQERPLQKHPSSSQNQFSAPLHSLSKWRPYTILPFAAMLTFALLLTGCNTNSTAGQTLTVLDDQQTTPAEETVTLTSLDKLDKVYGRTWLSADELIINRDNRLLIHNAATGKETELTPGRKGLQLLATASPDGKYVYFTEGVPDDRYTIYGYMLNVATGKVNKVGLVDMVNEATWADNTHLISGRAGTGLQMIDVQGQITKLSLQEEHPAENIQWVQQSGSQIYYLGDDGKGYSVLNRADISKRQAATILTGTMNFDVMPGGKQIAVLQQKWNSNEPTKLIIVDNNGKMLGTISEGTLLGRPAWSPDGKLLAFTIYQESQQGMKGLYIFDQTTGKMTPITSELQAYNTSIRWNPDGTRLSLYQEDNGTVTAIVGIGKK